MTCVGQNAGLICLGSKKTPPHLPLPLRTIPSSSTPEAASIAAAVAEARVRDLEQRVSQARLSIATNVVGLRERTAVRRALLDAQQAQVQR